MKPFKIGSGQISTAFDCDKRHPYPLYIFRDGHLVKFDEHAWCNILWKQGKKADCVTTCKARDCPLGFAL